MSQPLSDTQLAEYMTFAHRLADAAGQVIRPHFRVPLDVSNKAAGGYDPVTIADRDAEAAIRVLIHETYPDHGIHGEEHGVEAGSAGLTWVIDPIDGTRAFITGLPLWGTLIALNDGTQPVLGLMDQPCGGERFVGSRWGTQFKTAGRILQLNTRTCPELAQAVLFTTHPDLLAPGPEREAFFKLAGQVRMSRYGGDCYAYCMLAHGFIDLVVEAGLKPYDIQALIPIVEGAGGVITAWNGGPAAGGGRVVAASDPRLHAQALEVLAAA